MGWGVKPMSVNSGKRIDRERIKIERSLDRQANEAIPIVVFSQKSEGWESMRPI